MRPRLKTFCARRDLYLDVPGERPGVRRGKKIRWTDRYGNEHDLDFVIERGGSFEKQGRPVAFIEAAWRRYTKHSRNKAQEIQALHQRFIDDCKPLINQFLDELGDVLDRMVDSVTILPLNGEEHVFGSLSEAEQFVDAFDPKQNLGTFQKYEAVVKYSNGDRVDGSFVDKKGLKRFLSYVGG